MDETIDKFAKGPTPAMLFDRLSNIIRQRRLFELLKAAGDWLSSEYAVTRRWSFGMRSPMPTDERILAITNVATA